MLNQLLRLPGFEERVVGSQGTPLTRSAEQLQWRIETGGGEKIDYRLALVFFARWEYAAPGVDG